MSARTQTIVPFDIDKKVSTLADAIIIKRNKAIHRILGHRLNTLETKLGYGVHFIHNDDKTDVIWLGTFEPIK